MLATLLRLTSVSASESALQTSTRQGSTDAESWSVERMLINHAQVHSDTQAYSDAVRHERRLAVTDIQPTGFGNHNNNVGHQTAHIYVSCSSPVLPPTCVRVVTKLLLPKSAVHLLSVCKEGERWPFSLAKVLEMGREAESS